MDPEAPVQRRLRAARALAGITVKDLAARINEAGLGDGTIGAIERGERTPQRSELVVIAEACGVPYEFFTADLAALGAGGGEQLAAIEARLDAIDQNMVAALNNQGSIQNYLNKLAEAINRLTAEPAMAAAVSELEGPAAEAPARRSRSRRASSGER